MDVPRRLDEVGYAAQVHLEFVPRAEPTACPCFAKRLSGGKKQCLADTLEHAVGCSGRQT